MLKNVGAVRLASGEQTAGMRNRVFYLAKITECSVKAKGTKTKQTRNKNTRLKPKQKSEEYLE
jgi:hypothetical protein